MPSIRVNNLEMFYIENKIDGIPLIFIHGWLGSTNEWIYQNEFFKSKNHVIIIDLPGFGKSDKPKRRYSIDFFTKQILDFLKNLSYEETYIIGHSLGGLIAQNIAVKKPKLVKKLVLISTAASFSQSIKEKIILIFVKLMFTLFYKNFLKNVIMRILNEKVVNNSVLEHYNEALKIPKSVILSTFKHMTLKANFIRDLSKIHQHTLIIYGSEDKIVSKTMIDQLNNLIPYSEIKIIRNSPHRVMVNDHELVNKAIDEFINI